MKISVFDITSGRILRTVQTHVGMAGLQVNGQNEDWIAGSFADDKFYVESFAAVAMPPKPSPHHTFNYTTKQWVLNVEALTASILAQRAQLLQASDWTQLPDVPLATKEAWATYRQELRDITEHPGYPLEVVWPVAP